MTYGYCRVSSADQNLDRQYAQLREYIDDDKRILADRQSGKDFNRLYYNLLVGTDDTAPLLRRGDLLIICSLDRLGRNYTEVQAQWRKITQEIGADIQVLDMPLLNTRGNDNSLDGRFVSELVLQILSYVAEKERLSIKARQMQGLDCMRVVDGKRYSNKTGRPSGRPPAVYPQNWAEVYEQWKRGDITALTAREMLALKKSTFYKLASQYEK